MFKFWKNFFLYEISITNAASITVHIDGNNIHKLQ